MSKTHACVEHRLKADNKTAATTHHVVSVDGREQHKADTQKEAADWATVEGYAVHVARERHLQLRDTPAHWRAYRSFSPTGAKTVLDFFDEIKEDEFENYSLFRNEYNSSKTTMNDFIQSELDESERFTNHFLKTRIGADQTVAQSQVMYAPLFFYKSSTLVLNDYRSMAEKLTALKEGAK